LRIKLEPRWTKELAALPESGMGYQRVDVRFADGRHLEDVVVLNAEYLDVPATFEAAEVQEMKLHRD
jgi:hypothetical protein